MKIFLNPGHDRQLDPGAVNQWHKVTEADIAWDVGLLLKQELESMGADVMILQQDNLNGESGPYLASVCQVANRWGADIFVSLHCNAFNGNAYGTETLVYEFGGAADTLANCIQNSVAKNLCMHSRGVKERPDLIVLKRTAMPACLVELGFIDSIDIEKLISRKADFAKAVAAGIKEYFNSWED